MKLFKLFLCAAFIAVLTSCGGSGYNASTCEKLKDKIENKEEITESDYNTMIDQVVACAKELKAKTDAAKDDPEKLKELKEDQNIKDMLNYTLGFTMYIQSHAKDLSPDNIKKFAEAQKELQELGD